MLTFKQFIAEGKIAFDRKTNHGFWDNDDKDYVDVYHGTHKKNIPSIEQNGLNRHDPRTGMISVTMDPRTAHAYASMSGGGGEANFRRVGKRPVTTPDKDRAVAKFRIPKHWLKANMDPHLGGNMDDARTRMASKETYNNWRSQNKTGSDNEYYSRTEFRLKKPIPREFYVGHSFKVES